MRRSFPQFAVAVALCLVMFAGCGKQGIGGQNSVKPTPLIPGSDMETRLRSKGEVIFPRPLPRGMCTLSAPICSGVNQVGDSMPVSGSFGNAKSGQVPFQFPGRPQQWCAVYPLVFDDEQIYVAAVYCNRPAPWAELEAKLRAEGDLVLSGPAPAGDCTLGGVVATFDPRQVPSGKVCYDPLNSVEKEYKFPVRPGFDCKVYAIQSRSGYSVIAAAVYVPVKNAP